MTTLKRIAPLSFILLLLLAVGSCSDASRTVLQPPQNPLHTAIAPSLIECPANQTLSTSGLVTPLGGTVSLGGTSIVLPAGAVLDSTTIEVTIPASRYMEVEITANGGQHLLFQLPVVVTLDYSRCTRSNIDQAPLTVWYIDPLTGALLENMRGADNKLTRTITFSTGHLSGYAVAN